MNTEGLLYRVYHVYLRFIIQDAPRILKVYYTECLMSIEGLLYRVPHEYLRFTIQNIP